MNSTAQKFLPSRGSETFVLVHGAWHGAWCWEKVEVLLHSLGHKTIAIDLPAHGNNPGKITDQSLETYANYVVEILDQQNSPVILVGHSMAGAIITAAAEKRPEKIKKIVYLAAFLLKSGQSGHGIDGTGLIPKDLVAYSPDGITAACSKDTLKSRYAQLCSIADQEYICSNLTQEVIAPLITPVFHTPERWGSIRRFFIAGSNDLAFNPDVVNRMLTALPCEEAYELLGDHDLFYSAPVELAYVLNRIALK